jgi:transcription initiation factor TFIIIB Brf1 subunit/transcription initiation factor TFIIB
MSSTSDNSVKSRLVQVGDQLQIPSDTLQITLVRLDQLRNEPDVAEEGFDEAAAAALALSCREDGLPVSENEIESAWSDTFDSSDREISMSYQQLEAVASYIDMDEVPSHPNELVRNIGDAVDMPEELVNVAHRLLHDAFEADPTVVAGGPSPAATAGAVLSLAAVLNGRGDAYPQDRFGQATGTSEVTVRNRSQDLRDLLGDDQLQDEKYVVAVDDGADTTEPDAADAGATAQSESAQSTAADGAGATETATDDSGTSDTTAAGGDLTVDAVEGEIDALVEELDMGASARLLARGMVSDAVKAVDGGDPSELAATMVVAASRMEESDIDAVDVAGLRSFEPRVIAQWLDTLDDAVDVDIPRRGPEDIIEDLVAELGLPDAVHEEAVLTLDRFDGGDDYTAAELASGVVMFAATVGRSDVSAEDISAISGAGPEYVTDAMNSVVVSLCRGLIRGEFDYDDCSWTANLLESELSTAIGDSETGRVIAMAQTFVAGREGRHIDESTLQAVLTDD